MSWQDFFSKAKLNEYEFERILSAKFISTDNQVLNKIAVALDCTISDLLMLPNNTSIKKLNKQEENKQKCQELLPSFNNINIDLFTDSVAKVEEIISSENRIVDVGQRVRAYMAFYELADNFINNN
jgi:DNA-binding Xre family transcriptional regulator